MWLSVESNQFLQGIIVDSGHCKALGVKVEFESMMKIKSENESEND